MGNGTPEAYHNVESHQSDLKDMRLIASVN